MEFNLINVGIADLQVAPTPNILRTILGSCVGICLYDPEGKVGGLAHIMLPAHRSDDSPKKKYANTAAIMLVEEIEKIGGKKELIWAKIIGGSNMFSITRTTTMLGDIGKKNIDAVRAILDLLKIKIISEDVGGDYGRTIDFYIETGMVRVKVHGREVKTI